MDLVDRLKDFIQISGYSSTQFADQAQISRATLSQILSGRNKKISNELITKLHEAFPSLDIMWLLFGERSNSTDSLVSLSDENSLFTSNAQSDRKETNVEDSKEDKLEPNSLNNRKIQDDEILNFANDFFPKSPSHPKNHLKIENSVSEDVNGDNTRNNSPSRYVTSIVIFYSDGTFENVQTI